VDCQRSLASLGVDGGGKGLSARSAINRSVKIRRVGVVSGAFVAGKPLNLRIYTLQNSHVGRLFPVARPSTLASSQRRSNAVRPLKIVSSRIASSMADWSIARDSPAKSAGRKEMGRAATAAWLIPRLIGRASSSNSGRSVPSAQPLRGRDRACQRAAMFALRACDGPLEERIASVQFVPQSWADGLR
jgi:hypothetical protein